MLVRSLSRSPGPIFFLPESEQSRRNATTPFLSLPYLPPIKRKRKKKKPIPSFFIDPLSERIRDPSYFRP